MEPVELYQENNMNKRTEDDLGNNRLLTIAEAADIAAMKINTMYALCQRQVLSSVKIGKMRRIKEADLVSWINSNTVHAKTSGGI